MSRITINKIAAEFVVWILNITEGEITFPDKKKKKGYFIRRGKTGCTLIWDIPASLDKALSILSRKKWTLDLREENFDEIQWFDRDVTDEYYYKDVEENYYDDLGDERFISSDDKSYSVIHSTYGIKSIILTDNSGKEYHSNTDSGIFFDKLRLLFKNKSDIFYQVKDNLNITNEPETQDRVPDIMDDPIPF